MVWPELLEQLHSNGKTHSERLINRIATQESIHQLSLHRLLRFLQMSLASPELSTTKMRTELPKSPSTNAALVRITIRKTN